MRRVYVRLLDSVADVVDGMRGSQARTDFIQQMIVLGMRAMHEQASRNAPRGFGLAPLKKEGEYFYVDQATIPRNQALLDRLKWM